MKEKFLKLFYDVVRIRLVEEEIARRYPEQQMRCPVHLSVGQESTPVGISHHLKLEDHAVSTHRAHAHYLAKGGDLKALISELYGKLPGCTGGQGGSMHLIDLSQNFIASTSIVGGTIPVGVGSALTAKLKGENRISVVYIGDTAVEEGVFHESLNFASLKKLPVLFVCENNNYSCYSPLKNRQPNRPLTELAKAHGAYFGEIDGQNVYEVYEKGGHFVDYVRSGEGPAFIELKTFRILEHCGPYNDDHLGYREAKEIEVGTKDDAIVNARKFLEEKGLYTSTWEEQIRTEIMNEINEAFDFAINAPYPPKSHLGAFTYATL